MAKLKKFDYDFDYQKLDDNNWYHVITLSCRYPKMTKIYKELKKKFENGKIKGFGYDYALPF